MTWARSKYLDAFMTVVLQLPEDVAQLLSARARSCGVALPEYLQAVLRHDALREDWISLREAQALTGLQRIRLREAIARGELEGKKSGRLWRVRRDELEGWSRVARGQSSQSATAQIPQRSAAASKVPSQAEGRPTPSSSDSEGARSAGHTSSR